jgi:arylsulfatase A
MKNILPLFCLLANSLVAADKPNVILINADDLGYGDLSCYGATKLKTPNVDRLAKEGRRFTDAHSASAVCCPSRYGLLTGRYPLRRNFWGPIKENQPLTIDPGKLTLAALMKDAGYNTACVGKWHLGLGEKGPDWNSALKPGPLELGFDYFFGIPHANSYPMLVYIENHRVVGWDTADPFVWPKGGKKFSGGRKALAQTVHEKMGTTLKEKAIAWLKQRHREDRDQPFFLYLATTNIHHPYTPARRFRGTSDCGIYGDFIHELDWIVGEILDAVAAMGKTEETLVIFTSDDGGMFNSNGQQAWRAGHRINGDLLGYKFGVWEGGQRVPFIARWPGKIPAGSRSDHLISHIDLLATLAAVVGRPLQEGEGIDSFNQYETLCGTPGRPVRDRLVLCPNNPSHLAIRRGKWVYIPAQNSGGFTGTKPGSHTLAGAAALKLTGQKNSDVDNGRIREDAPPAQLYDLEKDPCQTTNVYREHPRVVRELEGIVQDYRGEIGPYESVGWIDRGRPE